MIYHIFSVLIKFGIFNKTLSARNCDALIVYAYFGEFATDQCHYAVKRVRAQRIKTFVKMAKKVIFVVAVGREDYLSALFFYSVKNERRRVGSFAIAARDRSRVHFCYRTYLKAGVEYLKRKTAIARVFFVYISEFCDKVEVSENVRAELRYAFGIELVICLCELKSIAAEAGVESF